LYSPFPLHTARRINDEGDCQFGNTTDDFHVAGFIAPISCYKIPIITLFDPCMNDSISASLEQAGIVAGIEVIIGWAIITPRRIAGDNTPIITLFVICPREEIFGSIVDNAIRIIIDIGYSGLTIGPIRINVSVPAP
jgi:hypothetical protein